MTKGRWGMLAVIAAVSVGVVACSTDKQNLTVSLSGQELSSSVPDDKINSLPRKFAAEGVAALDRGDIVAASDAFNKALKVDITNSRLQFLNALAYHLRARAGDSRCFELATEGYGLALRFDPSNWEARFYRGLLALDQRKFKEAETFFAETVRDNDRDRDAYYHLATSAYYSGDPWTAETALERLSEIEDEPTLETLRARVLTLAALNRVDDADAALDEYRALGATTDAVAFVERRVSDWRRFNESGGVQTAQGFGFAVSEEDDEEDEEDSPEHNKTDAIDETFAESRMILVDVVIIGTEEDDTTKVGVNLLSGLEIQFGEDLTPTPAISWSSSKLTDFADQDNNENTRTITRMISIPSITYSLNIANALTERNEIIARPTLVALAGQTSEFFSGSDISAAAVSGGSGDSVSVEKKVGVKLAVTPDFLDKEHIRLNVVAERTFLTSPSRSVEFDYRLDTSVTEVNANVVMRAGETLVLSGLTEKEIEGSRDGVPFLQDVPLVQYFFSEKSHRNYRKSVIILLTPRVPYYPNRPGDRSVGKSGSGADPLENDLADWLARHPNRESVLKHIRHDGLQRYFRTGDFALKDWADMKGHKERLRRSLEFIYF